MHNLKNNAIGARTCHTSKLWKPASVRRSLFYFLHLFLFQQFNGDWARWKDVGIEELYGLEYTDITDTTVKAVADLLGPAHSTGREGRRPLG